ncbi:MAG: diacylglycerol/polyprenol kinase family protein [Ignavibacteria bacterium]
MSNSNKPVEQTVSFKGEIYRKLIHIFSASIPIGYMFLSKEIVLYVTVPITFLMLLIEVLKYYSDVIYNLYRHLFGFILRDYEFDRSKIRINGASWLMLGDILCIFIFPKYIAVAGMLLLSLGDSFSAIIGRLFGRKHYVPNRSLAGTFTFFIVGIIIVIITPKYNHDPVEYMIAFFVIFVTTVIDSLNLPINDNFAIPVVYSALLYILYLIFFPGIFNGTLF